MTTVADFAAARRMTEVEYRARRKAIRDTYGDTAGERTGSFDQELARLFYESEQSGVRTQAQLAKEEGKGQQWVSRRLLFGGYLAFTPTGVIPKNLTEHDPVTDPQVYQGCVYAYNAYRKGQSLKSIKYDFKVYPEPIGLAA